MRTLFLILLLGCVGCTSTVTPRIVTDNVPSWDGVNQNSGMRFFLADGSMVITPHARDRYNKRILIDGARFDPPLVKDAGITFTGDYIIIDPEHLVKFSQMVRWKKSSTP